MGDTIPLPMEIYFTLEIIYVKITEPRTTQVLGS